MTDYIKSGFLELIDLPGKGKQMYVYGECMYRVAHRYNWVAFIDLDEYIVIRDGYDFVSYAQFIITANVTY